mmetsp:Transcript_30720/g.51080  ORF Transcript_30720/g.51080 Transcript_30720/m.51080 type:complete len:168 (-) Transcript_30720:868-1371(-)
MGFLSIRKSLKSFSDEGSVKSTKTAETAIMRNVRFANHATMRRTTPLSSYTDQEIEACWYSQEEYSRIIKSCLRLVERMESDLKTSEKKYCVRGLEQHTSAGMVARQESRSDAKLAVLEEQERQREMNTINEDVIAQAYKSITSSRQILAQKTGLRDHLHAVKACRR